MVGSGRTNAIADTSAEIISGGVNGGLENRQLAM
jgi:hypothetical protein